MHPNMARLLGRNIRPVFHKPTWPSPVDIPTTESLLIDAAAMLELEAETAEATQAARLREELEETKQRATLWQEECRALQRQMDKTYG